MPEACKASQRLCSVVGKVCGNSMRVANQNIEEADREKFQEMAETQLLNLHEGNFARYQVTPREFAAWQEAWAHRPANG